MEPLEMGLLLLMERGAATASEPPARRSVLELRGHRAPTSQVEQRARTPVASRHEAIWDPLEAAGAGWRQPVAMEPVACPDLLLAEVASRCLVVEGPSVLVPRVPGRPLRTCPGDLTPTRTWC